MKSRRYFIGTKSARLVAMFFAFNHLDANTNDYEMNIYENEEIYLRHNEQNKFCELFHEIIKEHEFHSEFPDVTEEGLDDLLIVEAKYSKCHDKSHSKASLGGRLVGSYSKSYSKDKNCPTYSKSYSKSSSKK